MTDNSDWISLNVGGKIFYTTVSTLTGCRDSVLYKMFKQREDGILQLQASRKDSNGNFLIDRDPKYFRVLLNYLRSKELLIDNDISLLGVKEEANYFQIDPLVELIDKMINQQPDFTRKEILLHRSSIKFAKRKLFDLDLQDIDFNRENFSYSNITNCNFNGTVVSRSTFLHVIGTGVSFVKSSADNVNFSHSNLSDSNFSGSDLGHSSFNNCVLQNSRFDESNCLGSLFQRASICASFKNANLEHAKFQKSILRGCDFTGAKIQNCHFTSADIRGCKFDWKNIEILKGLLIFRKAKISPEEYDNILLPNKHLLGLKIIPNGQNKLTKGESKNNSEQQIDPNNNNINNSGVNSNNSDNTNSNINNTPIVQ